MTKAARDLPPYSRKPNKPRDFEEKVVDDSTGITTYTFTSKKNGKLIKLNMIKMVTQFLIRNMKHLYQSHII
nr:hypothetical protein [Bacillus cereus]